MFGKVPIVALLAVLAAPGGMAEELWTEFTAKWAPSSVDPVRASSYYALPPTRQFALENGWTVVNGGVSRSDITALGYKGDPRFTIFFNKADEFVEGFQVANVAKAGCQIKYSSIPGISAKKINGQYYWTATIFLAQTDDGIHKAWYEDRSRLIDIPTNTRDLTKNKGYRQKRCFDRRGTYYSRITPASTSAVLPPWSVIAIGNQVVGFMFTAIGSARSAPSRTWYEQFAAADLKAAIPDASPSLINDARKCGLINLHVWLSEKPWNIDCRN